VSALYNRGVAYCDHLGQYDQAVADFTRATDLDPKYTNAWCSRGIAHDKLGRYEEAIADFSRAIDLDPRLMSAWYGRGLAYATLGRYGEAVDDYARVIELDPKHVNAWYGRGLAYRRLGQYGKAIDDYETALKLAPTHARALSSLAWVLATCPDAKLRDPDRAVELAKKAVLLAPKAGMYWNTLGAAHYRAGDWEAAVAALDKAVELHQGVDPVDQLFLAMAYRKLGKDDESRVAYNQALQWLERNETTLAKKKAQAEELRRFRDEAEEVLELKKK
jgi:tetratricopeptide (TPR) repeat protein